MKQTFYLLAAIFFFTACNPSSRGSTADKQTDTTTTHKEQQAVKRRSFKVLSEIDSSYSVWVEKQDSSVYSLSLHFIYKDTIAIAYSPECWFMYPYKIDNNKMFIYWDNTMDTKYEFDLVKTIGTISKKYIGKNFMTLELINDTTLKATYPLEEIRKKINSSNRERKFFPDKFNLVQEGEMYD